MFLFYLVDANWLLVKNSDIRLAGYFKHFNPEVKSYITHGLKKCVLELEFQNITCKMKIVNKIIGMF